MRSECECGDWIEAHGAQRWDIAGGERDRGEYKRDASEGGRAGRRLAAKRSGHEVIDDERAGDNQPGASGGQITPRRSYLDQGGTTPLVRAYAIDCPRCSC